MRSETLFLFWAQLFIEHAVAPHQNHMTVLRNDYITIGCRMHYAKQHLKLFLYFCLLFVVCCLLFIVCFFINR